MDFNATIVGQVVFINFIVMMYLTLKFAKGNTNNLPLVGFYTFLLSFLFFQQVGFTVGTGQGSIKN